MRLFSSRPFSTDSNRSILNGAFNYKETFSSFVKSTRQKQETALVMGVFANKLRGKQISLSKHQPAKIADIGCATSTTCLQYLKSMNHPLGFHYVGIDTNRTFINEAEEVLSAEPLIKKYTLIHGDALCGNLNENKVLKSALFDFIFVSHTGYYLRDELSCCAFLVDITKLLSERGIAIFLHEDSTYYFRTTYNKNQFKNISTPMLLEQSARVVNSKFNQFKSIKFTSKLAFSPLSADLWEAIKCPNDYKNFAHIPNFTETLEKLAFIVQRDLTGMAKEGCLSDYIEDIKEAIIANNNCLDLETNMQTLVAPQCALRHKIAAALAETHQEIPKTILVKNKANNSGIKLKM